MPPIRVLIVDDSAVVRKLLTESLGSSPTIQVAATASTGEIALAKIPHINPDVVTLDIEMPGMGGLQALVEIRKQYPKLPVIMFSTLTERGAATTLEALSLGASDYMTKPSNTQSLASAMEQVRIELLAKITSLCAGHHRPVTTPRALLPLRTSVSARIDVLAIGTSTGGPNALAEVIPRLPEDFPIPVLVVQHMPPLFTRLLADRLNSRSKLSVREAIPGKRIEPGQVWIARGDYHMTVERKGIEVILGQNQDPPENSCRPAVDVLFRSVAKVYGEHTLGIVMTGMGSDGARGSVEIREGGGDVFVQDEQSSVVWGMPSAVVRAGAANKVCALAELSEEILRRTVTSMTGVVSTMSKSQ